MLKCNSKNPKFKNLTIGKDYEGVTESDYAEVINDAGVKSRYHRKYFTDIPPAPPVPVIRQLFLEDLVNEIEIDRDERESIDLIDRNGDTRSVYLYIAHNSCGILEIEGLYSVEDLVRSTLLDVEQKELEHTNVTEAQLLDAVLMKLLRYQFENDDPGKAFYTLSTEENEELYHVFNARFMNKGSSHITNPVVNPNSGNTIVMWIIDTEEFFA